MNALVGQRRYPGARPFEEQENTIFQGRQQETIELTDRIRSERLLVLTGKSGVGKSSLLRAGVFPLLAAYDLLPIPLRPAGMAGKDSPVAMVIQSILDRCQERGIEVDGGQRDGLWVFFKSAVFWRDDRVVTPFLVWDQFEEFFTALEPSIQAILARELGDAALGRRPVGIRGKGVVFSDSPPGVKMLFSLREDRLAELDGLSGVIPGLLHSIFRIQPLNQTAARLAITAPAQLDEKTFQVPYFTYAEDALAQMLTFLQGRSNWIDPFQLQLLCQELESRVEQGGLSQVVRATLGGDAGMRRTVQEFYQRTLARLPRKEQEKVRLLCEEGLLSQGGRRKLVAEEEISRNYHLTPIILNTLVDARLLRVEIRDNLSYYELGHDSLTGPIADNRPWRLPKSFKIGLGVAAIIILALLVTSGYLEEQRQQEAGLRQEAQQEKAKAVAAAIKAKQARQEAEKVLQFITFDLRDRLAPIGRTDIVAAVQRTVDDYYQQMGVEEVDAATLRNHSVTLGNKGDLLHQQGDLAAAMAAYHQGLAIAEKLAATD